MRDESPVCDMEILSPDECVRARSQVFELRTQWVSRSNQALAFTLGASAGNQEGGNLIEYYSRVAKYNRVLEEHFEWLINRVEQKMSLALGEPVRRTESFGLPGFVIYLGSTPTPTVRPPVHYDRQFEVLDWTRYFAKIDFSSALSLTLPLSLPSLEGTGLYWWDLIRQEAIRRGLCPPNGYPAVSVFKGLPRRLHPYRIGRGSFHSAELPHQAAFPEEFPEGEERITVQVHSLICDGIRRIYF